MTPRTTIGRLFKCCACCATSWCALGICLAGIFLLGCSGRVPQGSLVITQTPLRTAVASKPKDVLDQRYPEGSRVVLALEALKAMDVKMVQQGAPQMNAPLQNPGKVRVLSKGLVAAGAPVVSWKADCLYFVGKRNSGDTWQIFQADLAGGLPKQITRMEGGVMDPAIIANGELVFSSPVPDVGRTWSGPIVPAIYAQAPGGKVRRLSYGSTPAIEPTVLRDGRILFISARPASDPLAPLNLALFTMHNDGTEVTPYALDHDGVRLVHRPRELLDGRVGFIATDFDQPGAELTAEGVRTARPFLSRGNLFPFTTSNCRSVEPDGNGGILACLNTLGIMGRAMSGSYAVFRVGPEPKGIGSPIFNDPGWNESEAVPFITRAAPMGHVSAMVSTRRYATILCLNANFTRGGSTNGAANTHTERVRVLAGQKGAVKMLGEVPVQADGSFMAEVPTDTPLGFEALDTNGRVLHRSEPFFWARSGENRSCIGCHEPYNRTIRNIRPLAASMPPVVLKAVSEAAGAAEVNSKRTEAQVKQAGG